MPRGRKRSLPQPPGVAFEWLTLAEAAQYLGRSPKWVRGHLDIIPAIPPDRANGERVYRFRSDWLEAWAITHATAAVDQLQLPGVDWRRHEKGRKRRADPGGG